ncbi:DUF502 domain-containing protein [Halorhabdus salina]|uniref:DUF502 domain-containing protein n=1 Tax=Halorhabdus salina TaxID=2750670 RepID=UPI0015EF10FE|nr:DUF502 domain-containing protein [Halorhabdus salina]
MFRLQTLRRSFVAGIFFVAPLIVTIVALRLLIGWVSGFVNPIVKATTLSQYTANIALVAQGITLIALLVFVALLGYLAQRSIGQWGFDWFDRAFGIVPLVSIIYTSVRQMTNALRNRENHYESVVLVEYPRDGTYVIGFVTAESPNAVQTVTGEAFNVFVPTSPNVTGGRLLLVPKADVYEIDISVRRGLRLLMTTGMAEDQSGVERLAAEANVDLPETDLSRNQDTVTNE